MFTKFYPLAIIGLLVISLDVSLCLSAESNKKAWLQEWQKKNPTWRALHLLHPQPQKLEITKELITDYLAPMGINAIILEVNYAFDYKSHPELKCTGLNKEQARQLTDLCRKNGIRLIPMLNCLGHQSWATGPAALLDKYPQLEETPPNYTGDKKLYCREWCASQPGVYPIVNDLMDELIDAFDADALHVGMDEVFMIGDPNSKCELCRDKDPGKLFAGVVNKLHEHLVDKKGVEMLMWADRLIDADAISYGEWEASKNGTHRAIDLIPKDIIMCDWHYELRKDKDYPSVRFFQQKGFRILPSTWNRPQAAVDLVRCSYKDNTDKMLGICFTGWSAGGNGEGILNAFKTPADSPASTEKTDSNSKKKDGGKQTADTIKAGLEEIKMLSKK
jgi:hypothetical protein